MGEYGREGEGKGRKVGGKQGGSKDKIMDVHNL
jgi:hypothetical protein